MQKNLRFVALLSSIEGVAALIWLASIPTSGETFSLVRLASLSGILLVSLGCLAVFSSARSETRLITKIGQVAKGRAGLLIAFLLTGISFSMFIVLLYKEQLRSGNG